MIIGIDIDDVLADFSDHMIGFVNEAHGTNTSIEDHTSYNLWEIWGCTREESDKRILDFCSSEKFKKIKPVNGSQEVVRVLNDKHDLHVITSRAKVISKETEMWIVKYFPELLGSLHFSDIWFSKGKSRRKSDICVGLGVEVLIEDCLEYANECAAEGIKILLFDRPWNQVETLNSNITRVYSWAEILEKIK